MRPPMMTSPPFTPRFVVLLLALVVGPGIGAVTTAEDDLLRFVPDDVGAYVRIPGLGTTVEEVWQGPLAERVRALSVYERWLSSNDFERLRAAHGGLTAAIGRPVDEFALDLAGTEVVLALTPIAGDDAVPLLLTRVEKVQTLRDAIRTWNRLDPAELTELEHANRTYFLRETKSETASVYYATVGTMFAVSTVESEIRGLLDLAAAKDDCGEQRCRITATDAHRRATADLPADTRAVVYISPRPWDASLPKRDENPAAEIVVDSWRRAESVVAVLRGGEADVVADVAIRYEPRSEPSVRRVLVPGDGKSAFLDRVPGNVLLVSWARIDLGSIGSGFYDSLRSEDRRKIEPWRRFVARRFLGGLDVLEDVLPALGPECGLYVVPRDSLEPGVVPFDALVAIQWDAEALADDEIKLYRELDEFLTTGLELWVAGHNSASEHGAARLRSESIGGVPGRWIEGLGPHQPTFALTPRFLVFASHSRLVPQFTEPSSRLADQPWFAHVGRRLLPRYDHLVLLDVHGFRRFVERHEEHLTGELARMKGTTPERASAGVRRLLEFTGLAETAFSAGRVDDDEVRFVVGAVAETRDETSR